MRNQHLIHITIVITNYIPTSLNTSPFTIHNQFKFNMKYLNFLNFHSTFSKFNYSKFSNHSKNVKPTSHSHYYSDFKLYTHIIKHFSFYHSLSILTVQIEIKLIANRK